MIEVKIDNRIYAKYGKVKTAFCALSNVVISDTPPRLKKIARQVEKEIREKLSSNYWQDDPLITSWMHLYQSMNLSNLEDRPASAQLIERILNNKNIYKINSIVDAANITAVKYKVPVGVFDLDKIKQPIRLRMASQNETMKPIQSIEHIIIPTGEIVYADDEKIFSRYSKDSEETKITEETSNIFAVVDGTNEIERSHLEEARKYLIAIIKDVGGTTVSEELGYSEAL